MTARIDTDGYCRDCRTKHGPWGHQEEEASTMTESHTHECRDCGRDFDCYEDNQTCEREPICGRCDAEAVMVKEDAR